MKLKKIILGRSCGGYRVSP